MKLTRFALSLLLALVMLFPVGALAAASEAGVDGGNEENVLNIFTWADYFPKDVLDAFEADTGIKVNFSNFASNEEMLTKLQAGGGGEYDIVLASDYIIDIARKEGLLGELDKSKIPNFANINPSYQSKFYDPENLYTVPYAAGTPLIVYDPSVVKVDIQGYEDLWDPSLANSIVLMDDSRVVMGITLKTLGKSFNETDPAIINEAKEKLLKLKPNVRILDYDRPQDRLLQGEVSVAFMFTPQVVQALDARPDLTVVYPKEGMGFGIDSCFVPVKAPHADNAYLFLDYILDGERSAHISEQEMYINCVSSATPFLPDEYLKNKALYIPAEVLGTTEFIMDVGESTIYYTDAWTEFKNAASGTKVDKAAGGSKTLTILGGIGVSVLIIVLVVVLLVRGRKNQKPAQ